MKPLKVSRGLTVLSSCLLLLPFSETMMTHMQMGNTYMSHVILVLWFFGMYLRLCSGEYHAKRKVSLWIFYVLLAIVCGMSGVRYLLALQCPLVLTSFFYLLGGEEFQSFRGEMTKAHFRTLLPTTRMKYFLYSVVGAFFAVAGYGINVVWISHKYVFQTYGATNFIALYHGVLFDRIQNAAGCLLMLFGYIPDKLFIPAWYCDHGGFRNAGHLRICYGEERKDKAEYRISQPDHTFPESQLCPESVCVYFHHQYHGATVLYYDFYFCTAGIVLLSGRGENAI